MQYSWPFKASSGPIARSGPVATLSPVAAMSLVHRRGVDSVGCVGLCLFGRLFIIFGTKIETDLNNQLYPASDTKCNGPTSQVTYSRSTETIKV